MIIYYSGGRKADGDGEPENVLNGEGNVMLAFAYHTSVDGKRLDLRAKVILMGGDDNTDEQ